MGGEPSKDVCRQRSNSDQLFEKPKEKKGFGGSLRVKRLSKRFGKSELKKLQNSFGPSEVIPTTEEPSPLTEEQKEKLEKNRVFSVPLALAASRSDPDGLIPSPISTCIAWLDPDHLEVEGIYRLSGSMRIIKDYVQLFDLGETVVFPADTNPHVVSGVLKYFLRELPDSIFTDELLQDFKDLQDIPAREVERRLSALRNLLVLLPKPNLATLHILLVHVTRVSHHSDVNKMTAENLGLVLSPSFVSIFTTMINNCDAVFKDLDDATFGLVSKKIIRRTTAPATLNAISPKKLSFEMSSPPLSEGHSPSPTHKQLNRLTPKSSRNSPSSRSPKAKSYRRKYGSREDEKRSSSSPGPKRSPSGSPRVASDYSSNNNSPGTGSKASPQIKKLRRSRSSRESCKSSPAHQGPSVDRSLVEPSVEEKRKEKLEKNISVPSLTSKGISNVANSKQLAANKTATQDAELITNSEHGECHVSVAGTDVCIQENIPAQHQNQSVDASLPLKEGKSTDNMANTANNLEVDSTSTLEASSSATTISNESPSEKSPEPSVKEADEKMTRLKQDHKDKKRMVKEAKEREKLEKKKAKELLEQQRLKEKEEKKKLKDQRELEKRKKKESKV